MANSSSLGQLIRQRRLALGLTQEELAELISSDDEFVRQTDISRLERARILLPRRGRLERLANVLGIPLGQLLAVSGWAGAETEFGQSIPFEPGTGDSPEESATSDRIAPEDVPRLWDQFQAGQTRMHYMHAAVVHEWQRRPSIGIDPVNANPVFLSDADALTRERANAVLLNAAGPYLEHLSMSLTGRPHVVILADDEGWILDLAGTPLEFGGREMGLAIGASLAEKDVGVNGVGTALTTGRPVLIHGVERFLQLRQPTACLGVPIHRSGAIVGALGIMVLQHDADPARLDLAQVCARSIETVLTATAWDEPEEQRSYHAANDDWERARDQL